MEITDFLTADFLASFTGTLIAVELIVFITKDFPLIKKIPTKIYTLILAIAHLSIERVATRGETPQQPLRRGLTPKELKPQPVARLKPCLTCYAVIVS